MTYFRLAAVLAGLLCADLVAAATPASGTLSLSQRTLTYDIDMISGNDATVTPNCASADACDDFRLQMDVPDDVASRYPGATLSATLSWSGSSDPLGLTGGDYDIYILGPDGSNLTGETGATTGNPESASAAVDQAGSYTVRVKAFSSNNDALHVALEFTPGNENTGGGPGAVTVIGANDPTYAGPRFQMFTAPAGLAESAGEPTLDVSRWSNPDTGEVEDVLLFIAGTEVDRIRFENGRAEWSDTSATFVGLSPGFDPILVGDRETGRIFATQLLAGVGNSVMDYTDDGGETWTPGLAGGIRSGADHQGMGVGPYPPGAEPVLGSVRGYPFGYPNAVYYCSQDSATVFCSRSDDGGMTFGSGIPLYSLLECGGLHGHPKVGPDGTVYLPNKRCGNSVGVVVSEDAGLTWTVKTVPGTTAARWDPSVDIDASGRLWLAYAVEDNTGSAEKPMIIWSDDHGDTWSEPVDVGAPYNIANAVFPALAAGDEGRVSYFFLGTDRPGNSDDIGAAHMDVVAAEPARAAVWYGYISTTYDGGKTWYTARASDDPVQRGDICSSGTTCTGNRNLLDFNDVILDYDGRIHASFADGCVGGCVSGSTLTFDDKGAIFSQVSGQCLLPAADGIFGDCALIQGGGGGEGSVCEAPGLLIMSDPEGDSNQGEVYPSTDLRGLRMAQLDDGDGTYSIVLSVILQGASSLAPNTTWPLDFNVVGRRPLVVSNPVNGDTERAHYTAELATDISGQATYTLIDNDTGADFALPNAGLDVANNAIRFVIPAENMKLGALGTGGLENFLIRVSSNAVAVSLTPDNMPDSLDPAGLGMTDATCGQVTPTPVVTPTTAPTPTGGVTPTPTAKPSPSPTVVVTPSGSPSPTPLPSGGVSPTPVATPTPGGNPDSGAHVVVAVPDSGINPYHSFFHVGSPWYPNSAPPVAVTSDILAAFDVSAACQLTLTRTGNFAADFAADTGLWAQAEACFAAGTPEKPGVVWFVGTNILATSFDAGTRVILPDDEDDTHGVGTSAAVLMANPEAVLLFIEGTGDAASNFAFEHPAVDVVSTSYGPIGSAPIPFNLSGSFNGVVDDGKLHFGACDNSPSPAIQDGTCGPWWSIGVAGFEETQDNEPAVSSNGRQSMSGTFPDFIADYTQTLPYCAECENGYDDYVAGTSFATPRAAGTASRVILEARRRLSQRDGIVKSADTAYLVHTPVLSFTNWELRRALEEAAYIPEESYDPIFGPIEMAYPIPPEAPYVVAGWGVISPVTGAEVIQKTLTGLGLGNPGETVASKGADFCFYQNTLIDFRKAYWDDLVFTSESAGNLPEEDPYIYCPDEDTTEPTPTPSVSPSPVPSMTPSPSPTVAASPTPTPTQNPNSTPTPTQNPNATPTPTTAPDPDSDGDGINDSLDACPSVAGGSADTDGDGCPNIGATQAVDPTPTAEPTPTPSAAPGSGPSPAVSPQPTMAPSPTPTPAAVQPTPTPVIVGGPTPQPTGAAIAGLVQSLGEVDPTSGQLKPIAAFAGQQNIVLPAVSISNAGEEGHMVRRFFLELSNPGRIGALRIVTTQGVEIPCSAPAARVICTVPEDLTVAAGEALELAVHVDLAFPVAQASILLLAGSPLLLLLFPVNLGMRSRRFLSIAVLGVVLSGCTGNDAGSSNDGTQPSAKLMTITLDALDVEGADGVYQNYDLAGGVVIGSIQLQ